ncbi:MAG: VWA domain-containing protein [Cytophagales bacterium]|nr:MAG: VWA domain-containing protein [Cytophagales bacterium]
MDKITLPEWLDLHWFKLETFQNFHWENKLFLFIIPLLIILPFFRWLIHINYRQKLEIGTPLPRSTSNYYTSLFRYVPTLVFLIFQLFIFIALARPQAINSNSERRNHGNDIVFVIDISESMLLEDFKPNRLEVAKNIVTDFIKKRNNDKIGIVVFSSNAYTQIPLTNDYEMIQESINNLQINQLNSGASAIGNAIGVAINRLKASSSESKIMILLSDGENTSGNLSPESAALLAKQYKINIHTIGIGKNGDAPLGKDESGNTIWVSSTLNEKTLGSIAKITKGMYQKASNTEGLKQCFDLINQKAKKSTTTINTSEAQDFYTIYLYWALVFFILWIGLKSSFMNNFIED